MRVFTCGHLRLFFTNIIPQLSRRKYQKIRLMNPHALSLRARVPAFDAIQRPLHKGRGSARSRLLHASKLSVECVALKRVVGRHSGQMAFNDPIYRLPVRACPVTESM